MPSRREVLNYIGTGAIGGMVGYYVGARELLGIQSDRVVRVYDSGQPTEQPAQQPTEQPTQQPTEQPTEQPTQQSTEQPTEPDRVDQYDGFEDGDLDSPEWDAVGGGPGGLAPENEIGLTSDAHTGDYALYVDQGGSISNFWAVSELDTAISPTTIVFWTQPVGDDQYTKVKYTFARGDDSGIYMNNHIQNDGIYFRFREGNDESDRERVRNRAIPADVGRFVKVRLDRIDWTDATIGDVYVDGELITTDAPFVNQIDGFDTVRFGAVGGGGTVFYVDDIGWG
jgi:hypothetical protein